MGRTGEERIGKGFLKKRRLTMRGSNFETDIEKLIREELEHRGHRKGIDFATQYPIKSSFILDFAFPKEKIAIEADGEPWHSSPEARGRDSFKNYILNKKGWKVLRFWGREIYKDASSCVDRIEEVLAERRG
jgi:very-short-patch-repair endonuclease